MYRFAINRPITVLMGVMAFIVFGLMSYKTMPVGLFPNVDIPIVTIQTAYYGADPESVESKVTDKIEEAVSGVDGIDKLLSTSYEGLSVVVVEFDLDKNYDEALNDVRDKVGGVFLPSDVEKPVVKKLGLGGGVVNLFISAKDGNMQKLMLMADEKIKPKLQRIIGVGEVSIIGFQEREVRIFLEPFLLSKYNLTSSELQGIIAKENLKAGSGKLIDSQNELILKARGDAKDIEELKNINIKPGVKLKDIAKIEDGLEDAESFSSLNGVVGVNLEIKKISGANSLKIIEEVKNAIPTLQAIAGENYELTILRDQSIKINNNIDQVTFDLIYGSILAVLIVFLFLRNLSATLVAALAIPTSIIGTFAVVDWLGYDLNKLTLIGLTLAIGIFIDDAIVVIENITKKLEHGVEPFRAAFEGIKELAFSILAISLMLLAVFIPVAFMSGIVGRFFNSFAMTVASGVVISFFVAMMVVPSLGARVLNNKESAFFLKTEPLFVKMDRSYVWLMERLLRFKFITLVGIIAVVFGSFSLGKYVGMDFVPMEDNSEFQILLEAKPGVSLESMKKGIEPLIEEIKQDNLITETLVSIGYTTAKESNKARIYCKLLPVKERTQRQEEIVQGYREKIAKLNLKEITTSVEEVSEFDSGGSNAPVQIVIKGQSLEKIDELSMETIKILEGIKGAVNIDTDFDKGKPEIRISILRENAARSGVSTQDIVGVLNAAFSSQSAISQFEDSGKQFDITIRVADEFRGNLNDIKKLQVRSTNGEFVSLEGLVEFVEGSGAGSINRFDRERKIMVTSNLYETTLDKITSAIDTELPKIMPEGYSYKFIGDIERMADTNKAFGGAVVLALILIYLILAALYESLIQPFIIMVSMPLSLTGVLVALALSGKPFSLFVMIGLILLLGMVGKNAVLVVDFANKAIKEGKSVDEALLEAGEKRLRPILMTTLAMIFAMVPLAFGGGAGAEGNSPMALAIIGGLISSTLLTLLVVPVIYRLLYPIDARVRRLYERETV